MQKKLHKKTKVSLKAQSGRTVNVYVRLKTASRWGCDWPGVGAGPCCAASPAAGCPSAGWSPAEPSAVAAAAGAPASASTAAVVLAEAAAEAPAEPVTHRITQLWSVSVQLLFNFVNMDKVIGATVHSHCPIECQTPIILLYIPMNLTSDMNRIRQCEHIVTGKGCINLPVAVAVVAVVAGVVDQAPRWSESLHPVVAGPQRVVAAELGPGVVCKVFASRVRIWPLCWTSIIGKPAEILQMNHLNIITVNTCGSRCN